MVNRAEDGTLERWDDPSVRGYVVRGAFLPYDARDKNLWLNSKEKVMTLGCSRLTEVLFKINDLRKELNAACAFASPSVQSQCAVYENGLGYARRTRIIREAFFFYIACTRFGCHQDGHSSTADVSLLQQPRLVRTTRG